MSSGVARAKALEVGWAQGLLRDQKSPQRAPETPVEVWIKATSSEI